MDSRCESRKTLIFSNFAKAKKRGAGHSRTPFYSIALYSPPNLRGFKELPLFYPTPEMLHGVKGGAITRQEYIERFNVLLEERRAKIAGLVPQLKSGSVLCCWCSLDGPNAFCHRQLVAEFLLREFPDTISVEIE